MRLRVRVGVRGWPIVTARMRTACRQVTRGRYARPMAFPIAGRAEACGYVTYSGSYSVWDLALKASSERTPYTGARLRPAPASSRWTAAPGVGALENANGVPDRLISAAFSCWNAVAAVAMRNSITPGTLSTRRR